MLFVNFFQQAFGVRKNLTDLHQLHLLLFWLLFEEVPLATQKQSAAFKEKSPFEFIFITVIIPMDFIKIIEIWLTAVKVLIKKLT